MDFSAYTEQYINETVMVAQTIDQGEIVKAIEIIRELQYREGRLFILGVGGSAASASHAVNDFRKIANIETYAPADNIAELTARANDDGWNTTFTKWLDVSKLCEKDVVLVLSVSGSSETASINIKEAIDMAVQRKAKIVAIVSNNGGYAITKSDVCILVPIVSNERMTPHAEGWHGVIWHLIVNAIAI
ncbi:MAG: SIS domain-containing protein [Oscillospiraceae bacterium]|jgi:D-sedoheptulose 7-phosphate isomerase|nr:SIS domain-containing protein [Oscillospiraceae bacterium]